MAQEKVLFKVVEICNVEPFHEPTKSSQSAPTSLPLTFFDIFWLRLPPIECLFFYELTNSTTFFYDTFLPNLKHSLSLTLQHFLPFAGNIIWPIDSSKPIINYVRGDSVSFTVVESTTSFIDLSSNHCETSKRQHLVPILKISHEKASLISIQVSLFPNNGFCIGITTHHAALDGKSATDFMKSWSYITCSNSKHDSSLSFLLLPENLTPAFDRTLIQDYDHDHGISDCYVFDFMKQDGPNNKSVKVMNSSETLKNDAMKSFFELTPSNIQKLKQRAKNEMKMNVINLSSFSVICAYVLSCLAKAEQQKDEKVIFAINVDCRAILDPPISSMYVGNCIAGKNIVFETEKLVGKTGFLCALEGINEALSSVKDAGVLNGAKFWVYDLINRSGNRIYVDAGSPRFEMYSVDFGFLFCYSIDFGLGKPKKVDIISIDKTRAFSYNETRNNDGGIEIGFALNKQEMETFSTLFVQGLESI